MTRQVQKVLEVHWVHEAARMLGEVWDVSPAANETEWPDVVVAEGEATFGVEVRELFKDEFAAGSQMRADEVRRRQRLRSLAEAYYATERVPIRLQVSGGFPPNDHILALLRKHVPALEEWGECTEKLGSAAIRFMRLPEKLPRYNRWEYTPDSIGWIRTLSLQRLQQVIDDKARKLDKYKTHLSDVRLLIVANRVHNSGKQMFPQDLSALGTQGFSLVYMMSYPQMIHRLGAQQPAAG